MHGRDRAITPLLFQCHTSTAIAPLKEISPHGYKLGQMVDPVNALDTLRFSCATYGSVGQKLLWATI